MGASMLGSLKQLYGKVKASHDDSLADRLTYVYTIYLLLGFAITLFAKNYFGEPLQCWVPSQWTGDWESFAEEYCFVENTYFSKFNAHLPTVDRRESEEMLYYQWVPFILSAMALVCYFPRGVFSVFASFSDMSVSTIMQKAREARKDEKGGQMVYGQFGTTLKRVRKALADDAKAAKDVLPGLIMEMAERGMGTGDSGIDRESISTDSGLSGYGERRKRRNRSGVVTARANSGSYLSNLYIVMKALLLVVVLLQLFLMNHFLGTEYTLWGWGIFTDMVAGRQWQQSGHFPRVAYCDLEIREMAAINRWTVQCVLMVNMFNEKIFIFLWFWYVVVAAIMAMSLCLWVYRRTPNSQKNFVYRLLQVEVTEDSLDSVKFDKFCDQVLESDGVLILRLVEENCGSVMASDVAVALWKEVYEKKSSVDAVAGSEEDTDDYGETKLAVVDDDLKHL